MELRKDRKQRFQRRRLVRSKELLHNLIRISFRVLIRIVLFHSHSLGPRRMLVLRMDRKIQRHSLVRKLICTNACSSERKAWL